MSADSSRATHLTLPVLANQLQCNELIINRLLELNACSNKSSMVLLKEKILHLEGLIAQIPRRAECSEMAKHWQANVVAFWERFAVKSNMEALCRLRRKLHNFEQIISCLLATPSAVNWPLLQRALADLAESILRLPCDQPAQRNHWTDKLVELWTKCAQFQPAKSKQPTTTTTTKVSTSPTSSPVPPEETPFHRQLAQSLNWLPPVGSHKDVDNLASLLAMVSLVVDRLKVTTMSSKVNRYLFNLALKKLPTLLQREFLTTHGATPDIRWPNLANYLRKLISSPLLAKP